MSASGGAEPDVQVGRWYYTDYGFSTPVGQCVAKVRGGYMLRFRWGNPWRTQHFVEPRDVLGEAEDPRWLSRLRRAVAGKAAK